MWTYPYSNLPLQACRHGHVQHLEHLLFYGADMSTQNASGNTALHVCALYNQVPMIKKYSIQREMVTEVICYCTALPHPLTNIKHAFNKLKGLEWCICAVHSYSLENFKVLNLRVSDILYPWLVKCTSTISATNIEPNALHILTC